MFSSPLRLAKMVLIKGKVAEFACFFVVFHEKVRKTSQFIKNIETSLTFPAFGDIILVTKE